MAPTDLPFQSRETSVNLLDKPRHACRRIGAYIAKELGNPVLNNVWIPDGYKDTPADRLGPRLRLKDSLDRIFAEKLDGVIDCVESKVFGIGVESYTVGSSEFYLSYAASRPGVYVLLDNGHSPDRVVTKIPSHSSLTSIRFPCMSPARFAGIRTWLVLFEDELKRLPRNCAQRRHDKVLIGLDFLTRPSTVSPWIIGTRNMQKALLYALLQPNKKLKSFRNPGRFYRVMMLQEELKTFPSENIWEEYCDPIRCLRMNHGLTPLSNNKTDVCLKRG